MMLSSGIFAASFSTCVLRKSLNPSSLEWLSLSSSYTLMTTFTEVSIVLVHTSLTTQSKLFSATLFKVTVQSKFIVIYLCNCSWLCRCLASSKILMLPFKPIITVNTQIYYWHIRLPKNYGLTTDLLVTLRYIIQDILPITWLMYLITGFCPKLSMWWHSPHDISRSTSSSH